MLTSTPHDIIRATVPVSREQGETITNRESLAFGGEIAAFSSRRPGVEVVTAIDDDDGGEGVPGTRLRRSVPAGADFYHCGPPGFMAVVEAALDALTVPARRRHSESFAPDPSFGDGIDHPLPRAVSVR